MQNLKLLDEDHRTIKKHSFLSLSLLASLIVIISLAPGCAKNHLKKPEPTSQLAEVSLHEPKDIDFDRFELKFEGLDPGGTQWSTTGERRGDGQKQELKATVFPGRYKLFLGYFKDNQMVYSSSHCTDGVKNELQTFVAGPNLVKLMICNRQQEVTPTTPPPPPNPQEQKPDKSDVTIKPSTPPPAPQGSSNRTFTLKGSELIDPSGKPFLIRGVNNPHNYWPEQAYNALPRIKELGFNSVRIVWCADNLIRANRCDQKDMAPVAQLEKILKKMRELKLVAMLNLQNATGSSSTEHLNLMAEYLLKPEVKKVLNDYQDMLLINIANEWYGEWDKSRAYFDAYRNMIPYLRREGLNHVLIIDARGWGQDFSSIVEHGQELAKIDSNTMMSSHMYDSFSSPTTVASAFSQAKQLNIPFMIGEFGCSHGSKGPVACMDIMKEASRAKVGLMAWSYSGNSSDLSDLDLVSASDWRTLTSFGNKILGAYAPFRSESKPACFFTPGTRCP